VNRDGLQRESRQTDALHSLVYSAAIGFTVWLLIAIWAFFVHQGYMELVLMVVTGFFGVAVGIPYILWHISQKDPRGMPPGPADDSARSFRNWASSEFRSGQGNIKGLHAAIEILLPLAAAAIAMTLFGIAAYFATGNTT
jgi:hypothetical protein